MTTVQTPPSNEDSVIRLKAQEKASDSLFLQTANTQSQNELAGLSVETFTATDERHCCL